MIFLAQNVHGEMNQRRLLDLRMAFYGLLRTSPGRPSAHRNAVDLEFRVRRRSRDTR